MTTRTERPAERLVGGYAGRMLLVVSGGWLAMQMGRQVLPPLLPTIVEQLSITPVEAGLALTLQWGLYALFHYPGGRWSDDLSRKSVLVAGLGVATVGFAVFVLTRTYLGFLAAAAAVGVGTGLFFITMRALLSDLYVGRRGRAFGVNMAAGNVGAIVAAGVAAVLLTPLNWRLVFVPIGLALVATAVSLHRWLRESYAVGRVGLDLRGTGARVFGDDHVRWLVVAYSLFVFVWQGVAGFLPTFLQADKGFSPALASAGFALLFVVGLVVMPISGDLSDRGDRNRVGAAALVLSGTGLAATVLASGPVAVLAGVLVYAVGLMAFPPAMQAYLMDTFADASMGGDFGAFKTVYTAVGSLGPTYVGFVAEQGSYALAFAGLVACLLVSATIVHRLLG